MAQAFLCSRMQSYCVSVPNSELQFKNTAGITNLFFGGADTICSWTHPRLNTPPLAQNTTAVLSRTNGRLQPLCQKVRGREIKQNMCPCEKLVFSCFLTHMNIT